jgi:hypothetical protein
MFRADHRAVIHVVNVDADGRIARETVITGGDTTQRDGWRRPFHLIARMRVQIRNDGAEVAGGGDVAILQLDAAHCRDRQWRGLQILFHIARGNGHGFQAVDLFGRFRVLRHGLQRHGDDSECQ